MKELNDLQLYEQLKEVGSTVEPSERHTLESPFIESIVGTLEYFGVDDVHLRTCNSILRHDKLKIYDFLGVVFRGGINLYDSEVSNRNLHEAVKTLIEIYILQKNVGGFGWWLRGHDLDIEKPSHCDDCIRSYNEWHNQTPQQRQKEHDDLKKQGWTIL